MKKLGKLKLNQISMAELDQRKMNKLRGGRSCACKGCYCAGGSGGVNTADGPQRSDAVHSSDGGSYDL
ncbi:TIGR04149 family rSAM-modified RiPP [Proteiniphilum sp. UBA5346]|jgi:natural product precursor|uniref:TIGR04149 family rSAM-modified RiPP n=1 Tax=Proteiniphilum sp. UBA5346 TaxID=1947277 RepID=UPI00257CD084|nr:TIGR04149 family rSAM-modified RiPP [Proteiniphilum sp. UBA5346]